MSEKQKKKNVFNGEIEIFGYFVHSFSVSN